MVKKRRKKGEERERLVIQAAVQAISDRGLANVRMSDIAELVGMSPGHITYYFESKSELLMQAIRWSEEWFQGQIAEEVEVGFLQMFGEALVLKGFFDLGLRQFDNGLVLLGHVGFEHLLNVDDDDQFGVVGQQLDLLGRGNARTHEQAQGGEPQTSSKLHNCVLL